jgi:hypothetical protein
MMRYKLFGRTGLRVSELCLGAMTFGEDWGWGAPKAECARILEVADLRGWTRFNAFNLVDHHRRGVYTELDTPPASVGVRDDREPAA